MEGLSKRLAIPERRVRGKDHPRRASTSCRLWRRSPSLDILSIVAPEMHGAYWAPAMHDHT